MTKLALSKPVRGTRFFISNSATRVRCQAAWVVLSLGLVAGAACQPTYKVTSFSVTPPLVCEGRPTTVAWEVVGPAQLRTERSATDFTDEDVPSTGTKTVVPTTATTFTMTAVNGNPAEGNRTKNQSVDIVKNGVLSGISTCDATGACLAKFTPAPGPGAQVKKLSAPVAVMAGRHVKTQICVTHLTMTERCIPAEGAIEVDLPLAGDWILQTKIEGDPETTPPPRLDVVFEVSCS